MNNQIEFVTNRQWDNYAKRIEKRHLLESGHSPTFTGIARRAYPFIIEVYGDQDGMLVRPGWRAAMSKDAEKEV